tara:strand:- start:58 stop:276 length:219 start_codon:yes stop_codon:yes gene_type:complete
MFKTPHFLDLVTLNIKDYAKHLGKSYNTIRRLKDGKATKNKTSNTNKIFLPDAKRIHHQLGEWIKQEESLSS